MTRLLLPDWSSALCWSGAATRGDLGTPPEPPDLLPLGTKPCFWSGVSCPQPSRTTVRSRSSSLVLMVAMAPSLNSKDVPPSTTMQASQQRERTHSLQQQRQRRVTHTHTHTEEENRIQFHWQQLKSLMSTFPSYKNCNCTKKAHLIDSKKVVFFHLRWICRSF